MAKITYTDKVALEEEASIADINKVRDDDMNEIKTVVNGLDDAIDALPDIYTGTTVPDASLGKDGDLYIMTEE